MPITVWQWIDVTCFEWDQRIGLASLLKVMKANESSDIGMSFVWVRNWNPICKDKYKVSISKVYDGAVTVNPTVQSIGRVIDFVRSCEALNFIMWMKRYSNFCVSCPNPY